MLRFVMLTLGYIVFGIFQAPSAYSAEDHTSASSPKSGPSYREGKLIEGTYFVIGSFKNLPNAHKFNEKYKKLDAFIYAIKSREKKIFRIVIGPVKKSNQPIVRSFLNKMDIKGVWEKYQKTSQIPLEPDRVNQANTGLNIKTFNLKESYFVIGVFRNLSNAQRFKLRFSNLEPKVIRSKTNNRELFRVVVGPLKQNRKKEVLNLIRSLGAKNTWELKLTPAEFQEQRDIATAPTLKPRPYKNPKLLAKPPKTQTAKKPIALEKSVNVEKPVMAEKPVKVEKPVMAAKSVKVEKPILPPSPPLPMPTKENKLTHETKYKPGYIFNDCEACPELIVIPAGKFTMGEVDGGMTGDAPATPVSVSRPIAMGRFEVTFSQWDACVSGGGCSSYTPPDDGWGRGKRPVINVNWNDAIDYAKWLSVKTGYDYRLPSEAEWEYAARGGSVTNFWWGDQIGINQAVCQDCGNMHDNNKSAPVGTFSPNGFGLYDTAGNLWEWTQDCYSMTSYREHKKFPQPVSGPKGCSRVLRGGGWDIISMGLRSSFRFTSGSSNRTNIFGFRVARELK